MGNAQLLPNTELTPGMQRRIFTEMVRGLINDGKFSARNRREAVRFAAHLGISSFDANVMIRSIRSDMLGELQPPLDIDVSQIDPYSPESIRATKYNDGSNSYLRISIVVLLLNAIWFYWIYSH